MTKQVMMSRKERFEKNSKIAIQYANYIIQTHNTIEATGKAFNVKRTSVAYYIRNVLPKCNEKLYMRVKSIASANFNDSQNRGVKGNTLKFDKNVRILEDELIRRLKENNSIIMHISEIAKLWDKSTMHVRKCLTRIFNDEDFPIKIIKRDMLGNYMFAIKININETGLPEPLKESIDPNARDKSEVAWRHHYTKSKKMDMVYDYLKNRIINSPSEEDGYIMIPHEDIMEAVGLTYSATKDYISKLFSWEDCDIIKEGRRINNRRTRNYYKLKERVNK